MPRVDAPTEAPFRRPDPERPVRGWFWRCFRDRPRPEDARDAICVNCSRNEALRWYCVNLAYYKFQRDWNRGLYRVWQVIVILSAASLPVLVAIPISSRWVEAIPAVITAMGLSFITLFGWREDYARFTRTVAKLRAEAEKWKVGLNSYSGNEADRNRTFVAAVNRIVEKEYAAWQPEKELESLKVRVDELESKKQPESET